MTEKLEFSSIDDVLNHFDATGKDAEAKIALYRQHVKELTGHDTTQPVTPLDVIKIVKKVFGANPIGPST